jgi:hypothetical protein
MRKRDELTNPTSCINRAHPDELTFVLLGRDVSAPAAIRAWVDSRLNHGKNKPDDPQIMDALRTANVMDLERDNLRDLLQIERTQANRR